MFNKLVRIGVIVTVGPTILVGTQVLFLIAKPVLVLADLIEDLQEAREYGHLCSR